jgi:DNA-directed RNA polymerase specialized sigma24 family protein
MRVFLGLSEDEIAEALQVSTRTVKRDWALAKAWLKAEMAQAVTKTDDMAQASPKTPRRQS